MLQNHFVKQHYIPYRFDIEMGKIMLYEEAFTKPKQILQT